MEQYVFLNMGELMQAAIDVTISACKRFGADKAEITIGATRDAINAGESEIGIIEEVRFEAGVEIKAFDIEFVKWIISTDHAVTAGIEHLKEAKECQISQFQK